VKTAAHLTLRIRGGLPCVPNLDLGLFPTIHCYDAVLVVQNVVGLQDKEIMSKFGSSSKDGTYYHRDLTANDI
jgi:hypothetical protein